MRNLKNFTVAAFASATVLFGTLAAPPTASAAMKCSTAVKLANSYLVTAGVLLAVGATSEANYWIGKASGIVAAAC